MKDFILIIGLNMILINNSFSMSEDYEKKFYWGCYPNSKQYLGTEKAKQYCSCTVKTLSEKFTDEEMDKISTKSAETQIDTFNFASELCSKIIETN